ncbi:MAG: glycosyltransferase family 39 protein [Nitrospirota bacterium]
MRQGVIIFLASFFFVLLPGKKFLLLDGIPFNSLLEISIIISLVLLFLILEWEFIESRVLRKYVIILLFLSCLKVIISVVTPLNGLHAKYYTNPIWEGPYERSTDFVSLKDATRIDSSIDFRNVGYSFSGNPFPLYFFNDSKRFNYYREFAYLRIDPPFSAEWNGYIFVPENREYTFEIISGDKVWMSIDGNKLYSEKSGLKSVYLTKGSHHVNIRFSHNTKGPKELILKSSPDSNRVSVIQNRFFYLRPVSVFTHKVNLFLIYAHYSLIAIWALLIVFISRMHLRGLDMAFLKRERFYLSLIFLVSFALRVFSNLRKWKDPQTIILSGGDDWLSYETAARSILLGDFLNAAFDEGRPFSFTPLYRYFLSVFHLLTGESLFFSAILQGVIFGVVVVLTYFLGKQLFSVRAGIVSVVLLIGVDMMPRMYDRFLGEPTATFLALTSFLMLFKFSEIKKSRYLLLAGVLFGLATGIRPNLLPFSLIIVMWIFTFKMDLKERFKSSVVFLLAFVLIIAMIPLRNYAVAGKPVLFSTHGPVSLLVGNPVPADVTLRTIERPYLDKLSLSPETRTVVEFMLQAPGVFFYGILRKFLFLFGVSDPELGEAESRVLWPNLISVCGMILSFIKIDDRQLMLNRLFAMLFILCNMIVMALIVVNQYGYRFTLPNFPFVYIFAAYAIVFSVGFVWNKFVDKKP